MTKTANVTAIEGFKFHPQCKVCSAKDKYGNPLRDEADALRASGYTYEQLKNWLAGKGIYASAMSITNHYKKHAAYAVKGAAPTKITKRLITTLTAKNDESEQALKKIISAGNTMIQNWLDGKKGPQMPVTQKLFISAIQEQGKRAPKTSMDVEFEDMEKGMIEGEEVK
jgi:hypothetical protein